MAREPAANERGGYGSWQSRRSGSSCETNRAKGFSSPAKKIERTRPKIRIGGGIDNGPGPEWIVVLDGPRSNNGRNIIKTREGCGCQASSSKLRTNFNVGRKREGEDPTPELSSGDRMVATLVAGWKITIVTKVKENSSLNIMPPTFASVWTLTRCWNAEDTSASFDCTPYDRRVLEK